MQLFAGYARLVSWPTESMRFRFKWCGLIQFRLLVPVICLLLSSLAIGGDIAINKNWRSIAIKGYDPVAYFTMGKAVKGSSKYETKWQDARWRFSSQEHKDLFDNSPDKYAPRFGGFCAGGIALGQRAPINPKAWVIIEGKLYLNYDKKARDDMAASPDATIELANENWKSLGKAD